MFERFFGPKSEEQIERDLSRIVGKEFEFGVNGPAISMAFEAARRENEEKGYGLHNNRLLNIVRDSALAHASAVEDSLMGGAEQVEKNINSEIERLRRDLQE